MTLPAERGEPQAEAIHREGAGACNATVAV